MNLKPCMSKYSCRPEQQDLVSLAQAYDNHAGMHMENFVRRMLLLACTTVGQ